MERSVRHAVIIIFSNDRLSCADKNIFKATIAQNGTMASSPKGKQVRGSYTLKRRRVARASRAPSILTSLVVLTAAFAVVVIFLVIEHPNVSPELVLESASGRQLRNSIDKKLPALFERGHVKHAGERPTAPCALLFFGLPRAFESLVLPSIRENILETNPTCDVFIHFYNQTYDNAGRSGKGGLVRPDEVRLLDEFADVVYYQGENEEQFWEKRGDILEMILNAKDPQGRQLYFPWKEGTYNNRTVENIVKMWHSIESAWFLMEREANKQHIQYERVAMLRSDVVYLTPIYLDEFAADDTAVVPGFGRYPVSDRMVYGPYEAVRVWASERFQRIEEHARWILQNDEGRAMHAETFMNVSIFPAMRKVLGNSRGIVEHPHLCFLRGRADETVWLTDCDYNFKRPSVTLPSIGASIGNIVNRLEDVLGRRCNGWSYKIDHGFRAINCARRAPFFRWHGIDL